MHPQPLTKGELRRAKILEHLKANGTISLQEIVDEFDCSEATARRDLDVLDKSGHIIRTIGGAIFEDGLHRREASFQEKKQLLWLEKEAIARQAATLVEAGDIVGLTGGTTTFLVARELKKKSGITVVTNAVNIAAELASTDGIQVVVSGGVMRSKSFELCGPMAEKTLEGINITKMFVGIDGISVRQGLTTYSESEAEIAKLLIERAGETIAVFDHTKAGRASLFTVAPLSALDACITDAQLDHALLEALQKAHVTLYKVEV